MNKVNLIKLADIVRTAEHNIENIELYNKNKDTDIIKTYIKCQRQFIEEVNKCINFIEEHEKELEENGIDINKYIKNAKKISITKKLDIVSSSEMGDYEEKISIEK